MIYCLSMLAVMSFVFLQRSGAYIFRPKDSTPNSTEFSDIVDVLEGQLMTEWRISLKDVDWMGLTVRKFANEENYEVEWMVGPIPGNLTLISKIFTMYMLVNMQMYF